jgi:hypothetical protein
MSREDEIMAAGKLALERAAAKKQRALLQSNIESTGKDLLLLGKYFSQGSTENFPAGLRGLKELIARESIERLLPEVEEYLALTERSAELDKRAKDAGID